MKLKRVKPSLIKWPEVRVTARFDEETRELLRKSVQEAGIMSPILAQEIDGELVGCDGLHRCEDLIAGGDLPTDVAVLEGDMTDLLCRNLFLDHLRGKPPVGDMVRVIKALYEECGLDSEKIKEKTGLPRDYIEKLLKISTASAGVQEALDQGIIGVGHAFEIARLPYAVQQDEIIAKHSVYRFPVKDLKAFIDDTLREMQSISQPPGEQPPAEPRAPRTYYCEGCKQETAPNYLRPVMVCPDCFGAVWRLGKARETEEAKVEKEQEGV